MKKQEESDADFWWCKIEQMLFILIEVKFYKYHYLHFLKINNLL